MLRGKQGPARQRGGEKGVLSWRVTTGTGRQEGEEGVALNPWRGQEPQVRSFNGVPVVDGGP